MEEIEQKVDSSVTTLMEEIEQKVDSSVTKKPKLHIWNKILVEDELAEALSTNMKCRPFPNAIRPKKKRNKKNKKKKKIEKDQDNKPSQNGQNVQNGQNGQNSQNHQKKRKKLKRSRGIPYPVVTEEARKISNRLKEKRVDLIIRSIKFLGLEEVNKLCSEVMTIEEAGGLLTMNGKRRRSPGGVYFHLIKSSGRYEESIVKKILKENELKTSETTSNFAKTKKSIRSRETNLDPSKDIKLEIPQDINSDEMPNIKLEIPQDINSDEMPNIKLEIPQDVKSDSKQDIQLEIAQNTKSEPPQDTRMEISSDHQDDELCEPNLCIFNSPLIISEALY